MKPATNHVGRRNRFGVGADLDNRDRRGITPDPVGQHHRLLQIMAYQNEAACRVLGAVSLSSACSDFYQFRVQRAHRLVEQAGRRLRDQCPRQRDTRVFATESCAGKRSRYSICRAWELEAWPQTRGLSRALSIFCKLARQSRCSGDVLFFFFFFFLREQRHLLEPPCGSAGLPPERAHVLPLDVEPPFVVSSKPARIFSSVVLPQPDGRRERRDCRPAPTSSETPCSARTRP